MKTRTKKAMQPVRNQTQKLKADHPKTMEELEEKYREFNRQRRALRMEAQTRFDMGEWKSEIQPLWLGPCGDDEEISKAWEALRLIYFSGEMPDILRRIIERNLCDDGFQKPPGYDKRHALPLVGLLEDTSFPTEPWAKHRKIVGEIDAKTFNQKAKLNNLSSLELLHPLDHEVVAWVQKAQANDLAARQEDFRKAIWARIDEASKVQENGEKRRVILEIDLSADDPALKSAFAKLISSLRNGARKPAKRGAKTSGRDFFKGLIIHYFMGRGEKQEWAANQCGYKSKDGYFHEGARKGLNEARTFLTKLKSRLHVEAAVIEGTAELPPEFNT